MALNVSPQGQFANTLVVAMNQHGMSIKDLAEKTDMTYENARRLVNGLTFPSKYVLREICQVLELDLRKVEQTVVAERLNRKYGGIPLELAGKKPSLRPLENIWDFLTKDQQQDLIYMALGMVRKNEGLSRAAVGGG